MKNDAQVRPATRKDLDEMKEVVSGTLFPGEFLDGMIEPFFDGSDEERWLVSVSGPDVVGVAYYLPEPLTEGTWNLKAIGILPDRQHGGLGRGLLAAVEADLRERGARLLLIDTSSADEQAPARAFYQKDGYDLVSTIRDYWSEGDDKVTFAKRL